MLSFLERERLTTRNLSLLPWAVNTDSTGMFGRLTVELRRVLGGGLLPRWLPAFPLTRCSSSATLRVACHRRLLIDCIRVDWCKSRHFRCQIAIRADMPSVAREEFCFTEAKLSTKVLRALSSGYLSITEVDGYQMSDQLKREVMSA